MEIRNIEKFFLNALLKISMAGVFLVLVSNLLLFPEDTLSISICIVVLCACIPAYILRHKYPVISVVILTIPILMAMCYQRLMAPNVSSTLSVVLIIGFVFSVMLKGKIMWVMHAITFIIINTIFIIRLPDPITAAISYSTLYFILTYSTGVLKFSYDRIHQYLKEINIRLKEKAKEIAEQNEELLQIQDKLSALNTDLENRVNERTVKIRKQNQTLVKYSYTNAHHLRGPVARLLGLALVYNLEPNPNHKFFIKKMVEQAQEIDSVIKQISIELESNSVEIKMEN